MTVAKWLDIWIEEYKRPNVRPTSYVNFMRYSRSHIKPLLGDCTLKDLRSDMVQKFINTMRENGFSPREIRETYNVLHGALEQAVNNDMLKRNVSNKAVLQTVPKPEIIALTAEEQERLIAVIKNDKTLNNHNNKLYIMALGTGLRVGELLALTWEDIDFDEPSVRVNKSMSYFYKLDNPFGGKSNVLVGQPKTKASNRTVPLLTETWFQC